MAAVKDVMGLYNELFRVARDLYIGGTLGEVPPTFFVAKGGSVKPTLPPVKDKEPLEILPLIIASDPEIDMAIALMPGIMLEAEAAVVELEDHDELSNGEAIEIAMGGAAPIIRISIMAREWHVQGDCPITLAEDGKVVELQQGELFDAAASEGEGETRH